MFAGYSVAVIIPALDEGPTVGEVVGALDRNLVDWVVVGDNGSRDATAAVARAAGASVVHEPRRGYGSACLRAIASVPRAQILVFMDADGSDDPRELHLLLDSLVHGQAKIVIGSRATGRAEPGALTTVQRFGNALTCRLVRSLWGVRYTDLGPYRALYRDTFEQLAMQDPDYGWTIEMQVKAAQMGIPVVEVPVSYRNRRGGTSKVSGTLLGSWRAGKRILGYVVAAKLRELVRRPRPRSSSRLGDNA